MKAIKKSFVNHQSCPQRLPMKQILWAWLGASLGAAALSFLQFHSGVLLILGSFGASCLLMFAYPQSPFAQPRNVIGGHFVASLTGLVLMAWLGVSWWSMALAVGAAVALMLTLRVPHPPAGSNPFIVMLAGANWEFLWAPTLFGSLILVTVALIYHRLDGKSANTYPIYWW